MRTEQTRRLMKYLNSIIQAIHTQREITIYRNKKNEASIEKGLLNQHEKCVGKREEKSFVLI